MCASPENLGSPTTTRKCPSGANAAAERNRRTQLSSGSAEKGKHMTDKNNSTRPLPNTHGVPKWLSEAEARAQKLVDELAPLCAKLKDLKPLIVEVQADFKKLMGSQTIMGCRNFKGFCTKKLGRTEQAVYAMIGDYTKKQKSKKDGDGSKPHDSTAHQNLNVANEDVERMRTGLNAVARARAAETAGDKAKADEAWQEYEAISQAEPLKSTIAGDLPNYKLLLVQLLGMIDEVGEKVPMQLITHVRMIRKRIGIDDKSFGLAPTARQPSHETPAKPAAIIPEKETEVSADSFGDILSISNEKPEQGLAAQA